MARALRPRSKGTPILRPAHGFLRPPLLVPLAGLALAITAVTTVKVADEDNRFCVACHLHRAIYDRTLASPATSLSAAHHHPAKPGAAARGGHPERCFTCHSGEGLWGWTQVTALSAWDAARWVGGDRHEPDAMRLPIADAACLKCHAAQVRGTRSEEESSLYHELAAHRKADVRCVACHVAHAPGPAARNFLDDANVRAQCGRCHRDLGGEG